ncbi:MAG: BatD family protein, partial [Kiritimatiellae bacterium]|nr:BatD family protein [Kiritimatiellia bacterium]
LITTAPEGLSDDDLFAWRKACANPTADAFAKFDFAEARLNEARCAILEGDWRRAIDIYSRLEWQIGQTPAIERGLIAALALRFQNPSVELPVWRQVGRPILRYGWKGRFALVFGGAAAFILVFWLLGRIIRILACIAVVAMFALPAVAQARDPFAEMEEMHRQMRAQMQQMISMPTSGSFNISIGGEQQPNVEIAASVETSRSDIQVGDAFDFILRLEAPKGVGISQLQLTPSETFGLQQIGQSSQLVEEPSKNPSNVVMRMSVPVRYDVPFKGRMTFTVSGMSTVRQVANGGRFSFTSSASFSRRTAPIEIDIKPLPSDNQPQNFSGIIADRVSVVESVDPKTVETNDVVTITYRMNHNGYLPEGWQPEGAAFEWTKGEWRRYLVADGIEATPEVEVVYYDPSAKAYRTLKTGSTPLVYTAP